MKVVQLLEKRQADWHALEEAHATMARHGKPSFVGLLRFAALYRAACADLALADAYQLPANTIQYLHQLVGRAHNQLYRSRGFTIGLWLHDLFVTVPRRMLRDGCLRLAFGVFWGMFIVAGLTAYFSPAFGDELLGRDTIAQFEQMYSEAPKDRKFSEGSFMSGFYLAHNAGVGLQCFAGGLLLGVGGLIITVFNAVYLGAVFGHMATTEQSANFFEFVTAHGPFELTGVVLASAAGMRLGFSIVDTQGRSRGESLRQAGKQMVPAALTAVILFGLAGLIEAFISPSALPYAAKAGVAIVSTLLLVVYFFVLGYPPEVGDATR